MMKKLLFFLLTLTACNQQEPVHLSDTGTPITAPTETITKPMAIDRTIKRIPLGDSRLIGELDSYWSLEAEDDLLTELIIANEELAILPITPMEVPKLYVSNSYIPEFALGLKSAFQEYGSENQLYTAIRTIWRTDDLHIVLAGTKDLENSGVYIARRTDLLVLKDQAIIDGITLYYSLSESGWGAYQLFYIDANKQIWLQRFVNDEESIQTMEAMSLAVLPNGKIRALSGVTGAQ